MGAIVVDMGAGTAMDTGMEATAIHFVIPFFMNYYNCFENILKEQTK